MNERKEKPKLFLSTMTFPYGKGEKTFIIPELESLVAKFDICIISSASKEELCNCDDFTKLDDQTKVTNIEYDNISKAGKIVRSVLALFNSDVRKEILLAISDKKKIVSKIYSIISFYLYAVNYCSSLEKGINQNSTEQCVIYSFWYNIQTMGALLYKEKHNNVKIITRAHGFDLYKERTSCNWQPFKKWMDSRLDQIHFICDDGKSYYIDTYVNGKDNPKYFVSRLGSSGGIINTEKKRKSNFILVSCSSVIPLKRVNLIIDALSVLPERCKVEWIHFGDGILFEQVSQYAEEKLSSKLNISYKFAGNISNKKVLEFYRDNEIGAFISTSETEGLPVSMQEAMSYGIPLIGTDVGGVHELFCQNGILMTENPDKNEIASAIIKMIDLSKKDRIILEQASLKLWKAKYDSKENSKEFCKVIGNLFEDGRIQND